VDTPKNGRQRMKQRSAEVDATRKKKEEMAKN
jgi:hypothetical protein